jgi:hypothetical protein
MFLQEEKLLVAMRGAVKLFGSSTWLKILNWNSRHVVNYAFSWTCYLFRFYLHALYRHCDSLQKG